MHDSGWRGKLIGFLASLTLEGDGRLDLSLPWVVCKYEDVFLDELPGMMEYESMRGYCKYEYEESTLGGGGGVGGRVGIIYFRVQLCLG